MFLSTQIIRSFQINVFIPGKHFARSSVDVRPCKSYSRFPITIVVPVSNSRKIAVMTEINLTRVKGTYLNIVDRDRRLCITFRRGERFIKINDLVEMVLTSRIGRSQIKVATITIPSSAYNPTPVYYFYDCTQIQPTTNRISFKLFRFKHLISHDYSNF